MREGREGTTLQARCRAREPRKEVRRYGGVCATALLLVCGQGAAKPKASTTSTCSRTISRPTTIHVAAGHMHLLGKSIRVELNLARPRRAGSRHPAGTSTGKRLHARAIRQAKPGDVLNVTCKYVPARRHHGGHGIHQTPHSCGARARRLRCVSDSRSRAGNACALCESSSSHRCTRGPKTRTSASSCRGSSRHARPGPRDRAGRRRSPGGKRRYVELARRASAAARAFGPISSTRTSSYPPASSPRKRRRRLSSSPRMVGTSQMRRLARSSGARRALCAGARPPWSPSRAYLRDELERAVPGARQDRGRRLRRRRRALPVVPAPTCRRRISLSAR